MIVYIVLERESYCDICNLGVFSSKEKALEFMNKREGKILKEDEDGTYESKNGYYYVEEYILDCEVNND